MIHHQLSAVYLLFIPSIQQDESSKTVDPVNFKNVFRIYGGENLGARTDIGGIQENRTKTKMDYRETRTKEI